MRGSSALGQAIRCSQFRKDPFSCKKVCEFKFLVEMSTRRRGECVENKRNVLS